MLGTILIIILILVLIGALPTWGHSRSWGYYPSGGLGLVLIIVILIQTIGPVIKESLQRARKRRKSVTSDAA